MIGNLDGRAKRAMARRFLQSDQADAMLDILTTAETAIVEDVAESHDLLGLDVYDDLPTQADRKELLRELLLAQLDDRLPEFWVEHLAPIEDGGKAAAFADHEDFGEVVERWADTVRESGTEGDDEPLADAVCRSRFGVGLDDFRELVVEWPEGREAAVLQEVVAGGAQAIKHGVEATNDRLEALHDADVLDDEQLAEFEDDPEPEP